ncbi:hypothetical protein [Burkholderia anthina]|uniref:Uncharacterized protein n=1 Tax=Burkholderia anthina TaxID=179879 RepID=A0A6P2GE58_9BURK|nr:hypothetical protein [Burkholderia anthina]MBM2769873.1 hypothetical protein [Burkholderia anthina]VVU51847.1 hypothetical protein BAN20980_04570 [Burkholderia anthina]
MTEPILSREEVEELAHRICMTYVHAQSPCMRRYTFGMLTLEQFARAIESAVLAKACGEPVAVVVSAYGDPEAFGEREVLLKQAAIQKLPYDTKLYALNRSKS